MWIRGQTIGAVSVLQDRRGPVALEVPAMHQRYRYALTIPRLSKQEFGLVVGGVETAEDRIAFQQGLLAGPHVVVIDAGGRRQRGIRVAYDLGIEFGID